jgi:hypothetical protein
VLLIDSRVSEIIINNYVKIIHETENGIYTSSTHTRRRRCSLFFRHEEKKERRRESQELYIYESGDFGRVTVFRYSFWFGLVINKLWVQLYIELSCYIQLLTTF